MDERRISLSAPIICVHRNLMAADSADKVLSLVSTVLGLLWVVHRSRH